MSSWAARLRTMAPAFFCAHVWRCILVLAFRGEYAHALTLIQVSAAVGDLRRNNMACGRHLSFFLDKLVERLRMGASQQQLENDEEMLAYVSGDMQGSSESAWVWAGSDPQAVSPVLVNNSNPAGMNNSTSAPEAAVPAGNQLSDRELHEWPGWDHIQHVLNSLLHESQSQAAQQQQQQRAPPPAFSAPQPYTPAMSGGPLPPLQQQQQQQQNPGHLAPAPMQQSGSVSPAPGSSHSHSSGNGSGGAGAGAGGGSSRISIKDIM
jgi:hypothetical protein